MMRVQHLRLIANLLTGFGIVGLVWAAWTFAPSTGLDPAVRRLAIAGFFAAFHGLAMRALLAGLQNHQRLRARFSGVGQMVFVLFGLGVLHFCGGLVGLALTGRASFSRITPGGGMALILGWLMLTFYCAVQERPRWPALLAALWIGVGIALAAVGSHLAGRFLGSAGLVVYHAVVYVSLLLALAMLTRSARAGLLDQ